MLNFAHVILRAVLTCLHSSFRACVGTGWRRRRCLGRRQSGRRQSHARKVHARLLGAVTAAAAAVEKWSEFVNVKKIVFAIHVKTKNNAGKGLKNCLFCPFSFGRGLSPFGQAQLLKKFW